jgi:hypothetical protein
MTMAIIQTVTLASSQANIVFSSIPQNFTDLLITSSARHSGSTGNEMILTFNTLTTNRSERGLFATTAVSTFNATTLRAGTTAYSTATADSFSNSTCYIANYSSSGSKTLSVDSAVESNIAAADIQISAGLWANTAAVSSIEIASPAGGSFIAGTTISLYGILKGSDGIVKFG